MEIFLDQFQKDFTDVCFHFCNIWCVESNNLPSISWRFCLDTSQTLLNSSFLMVNGESCMFTIVGSCSKIFGGWLELAFTWSGLSVGFLYKKYFLINRSKVISKKSAVVKFVFMVIFSPSLWKIALHPFLFLSLFPFFSTHHLYINRFFSFLWCLIIFQVGK